MTTVRLQLVQDVYMQLDGQGQIVLSGSVFDCPVPHNFSLPHVTVLAETAKPVTQPTSVRSVRTR